MQTLTLDQLYILRDLLDRFTLYESDQNKKQDGFDILSRIDDEIETRLNN